MIMCSLFEARCSAKTVASQLLFFPPDPPHYYLRSKKGGSSDEELELFLDGMQVCVCVRESDFGFSFLVISIANSMADVCVGLY